MAAGTIQVTPVGVEPGRDIFNIIGEKVKKAKDQAIEARQEADERIKQIEETPEDELTQNDIIELETLKQKRSQKGYFFKKALKFQTTDKIRTTMGKFQRDPELQNDPAATEKERFYAKTGMFRPGEMPDMSGRDEKNKDIISYVGKGFQMIMDAIDKVKARVNRTAESTEKTSRSATSTESTTESVSKSTENLSNSTENIASTSKTEVNAQQLELRFEQDAESKREQAIAEARSEQQKDTAGTSDVVETDQGIKKQGRGLFSTLLDIGGDFARRRRFGRRFGNRMPGASRARLARMRAGRMMNPARRNTQYTAPIGPQPMNSPTPWASQGGGFTPRMESNPINLSDGGIIAPIKPKKQKKLAEGGITGLISKFLPPPLGPMLNMMINPGGLMGGIGGGIGNAVGGAFQMLTNPTKLIGEGLRAVLPMNRNVGKDIVGGDKSEIENMTKIFQLPTLVGGGIMFASIAQIAKAIPFLGAIINAAKPIIKPILDAFGLPASVLGMIFGGGGAANAATMPVNFGQNNEGTTPDGTTPDGTSPDGSPPETQYNITGGQKITRNMFGSRGFRTRDGLGSGATAFGHTGRDVPMPEGTPISVVPPGTVVEASTGHNGGYGNFVAIKLDDGRYIKSNHHKRNLVKTGDRVGLQPDGSVKAIAEVGSTGLSTGPHMHLDLGTGYNSSSAAVTGLMNPDNFILGGGIVKGGNVKANAPSTSVAASPNGAAPSVKPDGTRGAARPGVGSRNASTANSTLSTAANVARSVNNIITNPVGVAADGLLNMFYPSSNK